MKQTITQFTFAQAFKNTGRQDQFTIGALDALFEYLDELDEQCDRQTELDVIAICCDWSEHTSANDWAEDHYGLDGDGIASKVKEFVDDELLTFEDAYNGQHEEQFLEYLRDNTQVIEFNGGILVASF